MKLPPPPSLLPPPPSLPPPPIVAEPEPEQTTIPALDGVNPKYRSRDDALHAALLYGYTRYLKRPRASLRAVWEQERVGPEDDAPLIRDVVSWAYFDKHARQAGWKDRRNKHWDDIQSAVERKIKDDAIQQTLTELGDLEGAQGALLDHILGNAGKGIEQVKPRSLEGAVGALAKLIETKEKLRGSVIEQAAAAAADVDAETNDNVVVLDGVVTPVGSNGAAALLVGDDGFDDDEIEAMAVASAALEAERQAAMLRAKQGDNVSRDAALAAELLRGDEPPPPGIEETEDDPTHGGEDDDDDVQP